MVRAVTGIRGGGLEAMMDIAIRAAARPGSAVWRTCAPPWRASRPASWLGWPPGCLGAWAPGFQDETNYAAW